MEHDVDWDSRLDGRDPDNSSTTDLERPDPGRGGRVNLDSRDRASEGDPRDVFTRGLDLPRGREREHLYLHGRSYELRGSQARTLAVVGAFRVVSLRDLDGARPDCGDVYDLRRAGLVRVVAPMVAAGRTAIVTLTRQGRLLLNEYRNGAYRPRQEFYAGAARPRELVHDAHVYRAYLRAAERLTGDGGRIERICLDHELKGEYQRFLQDGNRDRSDSDGRPKRTAEEIREWAESQSLPMLDGHVQFPDLRVEYQTIDGRWATEDIEVETAHYRGAHAAAKAQSGFTRYRVHGGNATGRGRPFDPRFAEALL
jgi:hypothetical protein